MSNFIKPFLPVRGNLLYKVTIELIGLGAGHVQLKISNPENLNTPIPGTLGELEKYLPPDTIALTFRILARIGGSRAWAI